MNSTVTHAWTGNNNSDPISVSYIIDGDLVAIDANLVLRDEVDVELQWSSGKLNALFIHCPMEARLRFNYNTTPQDFEVAEGGVFQWDIGSGITCPLTGAINNLRITRLNPTEGADDDDIVRIRINKDSTP